MFPIQQRTTNQKVTKECSLYAKPQRNNHKSKNAEATHETVIFYRNLRNRLSGSRSICHLVYIST